MNIGAFDIHDHLKKVNGNPTIYQHVGTLAISGLDPMLLDIEKALKKAGMRKVNKKKLFHILIEVIQNIKNYASNASFSPDFVEFLLALTGNVDSVKVIIGNYINNKEVMSLKSRIDMINYMSNHEVKHLYRGILDYGNVSAKGGAGLGLVDVVKRSNNKLKYQFNEIDKNFSFFTLTITVDNS